MCILRRGTYLQLDLEVLQPRLVNAPFRCNAELRHSLYLLPNWVGRYVFFFIHFFILQPDTVSPTVDCLYSGAGVHCSVGSDPVVI